MNRLETKLSHDYTDREDLDQKMVMINVLCGNILRELEQYSESENHFDRAVILADKLYGICPEAFEEDLARVNVGYAKLLVKTNRIEEANDRCSRAIDSYRKLIKISPQKYKKENLEANEVCNTANDSIKQHSPTGHHLLEWIERLIGIICEAKGRHSIQYPNPLKMSLIRQYSAYQWMPRERKNRRMDSFLNEGWFCLTFQICCRFPL